MAVATRTAILQALVRPASGQEIIALVANGSHNRIRLHYGAVHPALHALEREGLVRSWIERHGRGRPRRNFELTVKGVEEAEKVRESLRSLIALGFTTPIARTPAAMARSIRGCEEISRLARDVREAGVHE